MVSPKRWYKETVWVSSNPFSALYKIQCYNYFALRSRFGWARLSLLSDVTWIKSFVSVPEMVGTCCFVCPLAVMRLDRDAREVVWGSVRISSSVHNAGCSPGFSKGQGRTNTRYQRHTALKKRVVGNVMILWEGGGRRQKGEKRKSRSRTYLSGLLQRY